jgi:hypothetical protein
MKPMKYCSLILAALSTLFLSGCFQVERVVKLKADGSGTIEETMTMGSAMIAQMKAMQAGFGGVTEGAVGGDDKDAAKDKPKDKPAAKPFELLDEAKLKEEATKMGEGVTFVSAKKITSKDREGYTATFAFTDINKVRLDMAPPDMSPKGGGDVSIKAGGDQEPLTFKFAKGKPATLEVAVPTPKKGAKEAAADPAQEAMQEAMMPMMQQMFKDMRLAVVIEVQGKIVNTNAQFKDASRVTLADIDFNKILSDPAKFKAMAKITDPNSAEGKAFLKTVPGIKVETNSPVKISFQ